MQTVSSRRTLKLIPSTARATSSSLRKYTFKSSTESSMSFLSCILCDQLPFGFRKCALFVVSGPLQILNCGFINNGQRPTDNERMAFGNFAAFRF
jgi:hypothetical protein